MRIFTLLLASIAITAAILGGRAFQRHLYDEETPVVSAMEQGFRPHSSESLRPARVREIGQRSAPPTAPAIHHHVKRSWQGRLQPSLAELADEYQPGEPFAFSVPLFDGELAEISVREWQDLGDDSGTLVGELVGHEGSFVSLGYFGGAEAGSLQIPNRGQVFELRPGPDGQVILSELDASALGTCAVCDPSEESSTTTHPPD